MKAKKQTNVYEVNIVSYPSGKIIQSVGLKLTESEFYKKMAQIVRLIDKKGLSYRPGKTLYCEVESECLGPYIEPDVLTQKIKELRG